MSGRWGEGILSLAACACALCAGGVARADGRNVLYVLDVSGSMAEILEPGKTALQSAVGNLEQRAGTTAAEWGPRSGLLTFGGGCTIRTEVELGLRNESLVTARARAAIPVGATPLYEAIQQAAAILSKAGGGGEMVVLTDGLDNCGHEGEEAALVASLRASGTIARLDVASLTGFPVPEHDAMAAAGGGQVWRPSGARSAFALTPDSGPFPLPDPGDLLPPSIAPGASLYDRAERYAPDPVDPSSFPQEIVFGEEASKKPKPAERHSASSPGKPPARARVEASPEVSALPLN